MSVTIRITTEAGKSDFGDITVAGGRTSTATERGWGVAEGDLPNYSALGTGVTGKLDVRRREDGLFDFVGEKVTVSSGSQFVELDTQTLFVGAGINPDSGTPCATPAGDKSWTDFKTYVSSKAGSFQVDIAENGLINYRGTLTGDGAQSTLYTRVYADKYTIRGTYVITGSKDDCETLADTTLFNDTTGETGSGSTLIDPVAGRTVGKPQVSFDKSDGIYRYEIDIEWKAERTLHDYNRTTSVPDVDETGETLPRTGTPVVSQWWETGRDTTKLPEKPDTIYDTTNGTWAELYELQQPVQINERGLYDWVMNCKRIELPAAMLDDEATPAPKWIEHARQRKIEKKTQVIATDSQQVMRLMNGLVDDPEGSGGGVDWNTDWDWDSGSAPYAADTVIYHDDSWWKANTSTSEEPSSSATDWDATVEAPAEWDTVANGSWKSTYGKTFVDEYSKSAKNTGVTWNSEWDEYIGADSNPHSSWANTWGASNWNERFSPSTAASLNQFGWTGAGYVRVQKSANPDTVSGTTMPYFMNGLPGTYAAAIVSSANSAYWSEGDDIIVWYGGVQRSWRVIQKNEDGLSLVVETKGLTSTNISQDDGFTASGTGCHAPPLYTRTSRTAVVGDRSNLGSLLYEDGVTADSPEEAVFVTAPATTATDGGPAGIASPTGYPYRKIAVSPVNFYVKKNDLDNSMNYPRFGYYKDRYSNHRMVEIVRRTRRTVDTVVYRKYCAVHPHMLTSTAAFIPAEFTDDSNSWPSNGFWLDTNTLIKFNVSDGPIQMFGAQLYFVECIIEHYGEEKPDRSETSARDGSTRNLPQVDEESATALMYYEPPEVSSLYGVNTLAAGTTREALTEYGDISKLIENFEIRE
jgi:hypothetical protein